MPKVTSMQAMFYQCSGLTKVDFTGTDLSSVTDVSNMFNSCIRLTTTDNLINLNLTNITSTSVMFYKCINLLEAKITN